jgi:GNAT superfamily N-acetyltransferase
VGFGVLLPSLAKAFQKARGFMFPFGWWHLLKALKWNDTQTTEMLLVAVKPEYQGKGVGAGIMQELLKQIDEYKKVNPNIRTYLGASKGKEGFYEKFGFVSRPNEALGAGMILDK